MAAPSGPLRTARPPLLALLAAACSAGDSGPAVAVGFDDPSSTWTEGLEAVVTVRLSTPEPLAEDLSVLLVDRGTGSATPGADYAPPSGLPLVFPAGSVDGTAVAARLALASDGLFEGVAETVDLALARDPDAGATIGLTRPQHRVLVADADRLEASFVSTRHSILEGLAPHHAIQVRLTSPTGSTLAAPVQVVVADTRAGSATADVDYRFAQRTLTFHAVDEVASADLDPMDDGLPEGEETVQLALEALTPGLTVTSPLLLCRLVDAGDSAPRLVLGSGGTTYSPTADLALFPTGPAAPSTLIDLYNTGETPLRLGFPRLEGDARDFRIEWLETAPFGLGRQPVATLDWPTLVTLAATPEALPPRVRVSVDTGVASTGWIVLDRRPAVRAEASPVAVVYAGAVEGVPGSLVFLQLSSAGILGRIQQGGRALELAGDRTWVPIEPVGPPAAPCRTAPVTAPLDAPPPESGDRPARGGVDSGLPLLRLALETDTAYASRFPDPQAASDYAEGLVAATREILRRDLGFDLQLVYLGLWSDGIDPWITPDAGGSALGLLDEFRTRWRRDGPPVEADLYHFLSGAVFDGGVAELATYCLGAYGVSTGIHGRIDWDAYDGSAGFLTGDLGLFAHELGHNLGALHTQDHCPPLDLCAGNCLGEVECSHGTLMSYCALCGGWSLVELRMHPGTSSEVRDLAEFGCLRDARLPVGHRMRLRVTLEPDPLSPSASQQRRAVLRLRSEGLPPPGELEVALRAAELPGAR